MQRSGYVKYFLYIIFIFVVLITASGETNLSEKPAWILYEMGIREMGEGEYGDALNLFQLALQKRNEEILSDPDSKAAGFPEVEEALGDIFLRTEPEIAEMHYLSALGLKNDFYVENEKYTVYYKLSDLYKYYYRPYESDENKVYFDKMRDILLDVINEDPDYYNNTYNFYSNIFVICIMNYGFNKFYELYRLDNNIVSKAHSELGFYYFLNKNYYESIKHFLFYFAITLNEIYNELSYTELNLEEQIEYYKEVLRPEHSYDLYDPLVIGLLNTAEEDRALKQYLMDIEFYKNLYYLGEAINNSIDAEWANEMLYDQIVKEFLDETLIAKQLDYSTASQVVDDLLTEDLIKEKVTEKLVYKALEVWDIIIKSDSTGPFGEQAFMSKSDLVLKYDFLK